MPRGYGALRGTRVGIGGRTGRLSCVRGLSVASGTQSPWPWSPVMAPPFAPAMTSFGLCGSGVVEQPAARTMNALRIAADLIGCLVDSPARIESDEQGLAERQRRAERHAPLLKVRIRDRLAERRVDHRKDQVAARRAEELRDVLARAPALDERARLAQVEIRMVPGHAGAEFVADQALFVKEEKQGARRDDAL